MNQNKSKSIITQYWLWLNFLAVFILFIALLLNYEPHQEGKIQSLINLGTELVGSFIVTFLGVYISFTYAKKQEADKEKRDAESAYVSALKLLASELSLNEEPLKILAQALADIPEAPTMYYENFGFLIEMTKDIKSDVFYSLIASGALEQISRSDAIFNGLQQTYYNLFKTINGLALTREVFHNLQIEPQQIILTANKFKAETLAKVGRTTALLESTKLLIMSELEKFDVTFTEG